MVELRPLARVEPVAMRLFAPPLSTFQRPFIRFRNIARPRAAYATTSPQASSHTADGTEPFVPGRVPSQADRQQAIKSAKPFSAFLTDTFNRQHDYLRISITERCNLRCLYCMPAEGVPLSPKKHLLTHQEIVYLSTLFVSQGVTKIRLTGGEPTIHPQILPILRDLGGLRQRGLKEIALTTNGLTLPRKLDAMVESGVTGINLSLDTTDPFQFEIMTRRKGFEQVMKSIDRILEMRAAGVPLKLKVNAVIIRGLNDAQILPFVEMTKEKDIEVRFIEYMPFDGNRWSDRKMMKYREMLAVIQQRYPEITKVQDHPNDTSKTYKVPGHAGRVGFITSMTDHFCGTCNRLRITSDGNLKVCLFGNNEVSLRDVIRNGFNNGEPIDEKALDAIKQMETGGHNAGLKEKEAELLETIGMAVQRKKAKHAGIGVLEHMKNRPMILIGRRRPSKTQAPRHAPLLPRQTARLYATGKHKPALTHLTPSNAVRMVTLPPPEPPSAGADTQHKPATSRLAIATASLHFSTPETLPLLRSASLAKGDALSVARIAGIAASKMTSALIPLCHNIPLSGVDMDVELVEPCSEPQPDHGSMRVTATARTFGQTGVEMEALVAASVASLAAYDMCKAVDRGMWVDGLRVERKEGGRSGTWVSGQQAS